MSETIPIFGKFYPETRLQNKLRKIQSGSISNKRMARLYHLFKEHDNFFTLEKNRQSDRESPGPQRQNESNLERNKSVSGSMQFKQASGPAAPLQYRSIQKLLIRNLRMFLNPYQSDYLTVVTVDTPSIQDLDWWIQEMKFNCTRKICTPQPNVLIFTDSSDFAHSKSGQNSGRDSQLGWHINIKELIAAFLALHLLVPNYRNGHVQLSLDNTTAVGYLNHQGGTKSVQLSALATEIRCWCLERNIYLSAIHIPGLKDLFADPLSRLKIFQWNGC